MQIKNLDMQKRLQAAGFNDKEARVYVSLLELGGAYPSRIAEYAGLNRSTTYKVLLDLSVRGLVNEIEKRSKLFYQIERPEKIVRYADTQIKLAEDAREHTKTLLPEIEGLFAALKHHPHITYYEGIDGLLSIYEDMLNEKRPYEMLAFSRADELEAFLPKKFFENFIRAKIDKRIKTRGIIPDSEISRSYNERLFKNMPKEYWPQRRYVEPSAFNYSGEIVIYGISKVAIINFNKEQLTGIVIDDKSLHSFMTTIFELSWNSSLVHE